MPTSPPRWPEIKALFDAIAELPPAAREGLVAAATLDASSLAELRSLLAHHDAIDAAPGFMRDAAAQVLGDSSGDPAQPPPQRIGERVGEGMGERMGERIGEQRRSKAPAAISRSRLPSSWPTPAVW